MKSLAAVAIVATTSVLTTSPAFADPLPAPAACAQAAAQLPELLASAMQREGREGEMHAAFDVDAQGVVRSITLRGPRIYQSRVRTALESLDCSAGTPQHYALTIRFAAPSSQQAIMTAANTAANTAASSSASSAIPGHPR